MAGHPKHSPIFMEDPLHLRADLCPKGVPAQPKLSSLSLEPASLPLGLGHFWPLLCCGRFYVAAGIVIISAWCGSSMLFGSPKFPAEATKVPLCDL